MFLGYQLCLSIYSDLGSLLWTLGQAKKMTTAVLDITQGIAAGQTMDRLPPVIEGRTTCSSTDLPLILVLCNSALVSFTARCCI